MTELHEKYAPILRFNKGENFFPMRVDDMLNYSSLHVKGQKKPLVTRGNVTPNHLVKYSKSPEVFVRSVERGPLDGAGVVTDWSEGAIEMVYRWAAETSTSWTDDLASKAYSWFSPKTKGATQLFWWNNMVAELVQGAVESVEGDELPRLILPAETQASAAEKYRSYFKKSPGYTYYHRQVKDGNYLCLQYWLFYSFNDWGQSYDGMNDHEGDWESMHLFFRLDRQGRPQEPPAYITFANHESRQTKPWGHKDVIRVGTHPVGYVGAGSHATYPEATSHTLLELYGLVDQARGDGVTIDHDEWVHRIDLDDVSMSWLGAYQGSWGTRYWLSTAKAKSILQVALAVTPFSALVALSTPNEIELPGVSAPRGPVGKHRPQYANPVTWAGVPE
jgi:hypothetical protein